MDIQQQIEAIKAQIAELEDSKRNDREIARILNNTEKRRISRAFDQYRPMVKLIVEWLGAEVEETLTFSKRTVKVYEDGDLTVSSVAIRWHGTLVFNKDTYEPGDGKWVQKIKELYPQAQLAELNAKLSEVKQLSTEKDEEFSALLGRLGLSAAPVLPESYLPIDTKVWQSVYDDLHHGWSVVRDYDYINDLYLLDDDKWYSRDKLMNADQWHTARKAQVFLIQEEALSAETEKELVSLGATDASPRWESGKYYDVDINEIRQLQDAGYDFDILSTGTGTRFDSWNVGYPVMMSRIRITSVPQPEVAESPLPLR